MAELRLRPPQPADAEAVATLVNEHSVSIGLPPDTATGDVTAWWAADNVIATVAEAGGEVVGYGDLYVRRNHVRLDAGGRDGQEQLLDELERRAAEHAAVVRTVLHERDPVRERLAARGYRSVRGSYDMEITLDQALEAPDWPDGIVPRAARAGDEPTFYRVHEEAFADHWGYAPRAYEEWAHLYGTLRPFDPKLWLVAEEDGQPAGIAICEGGKEGDEQTGWVHVIAVRRPWRGRGLGLALLRWSFQALATHGLRTAALGVDAENTTGAVRLYERAGMRVVQRSETWELEL
jgi:mycothiol synthase